MNQDPTPDAVKLKPTTGFNYFVSYGGGIGPDVWDRELQIGAVDIQDAIAQAQGHIEECGGWIFQVSQEDYPPSTREQLEGKIHELQMQLQDTRPAPPSPEQPEDGELLDYLQSLTKGYGLGWMLRESSNGRGMRLYETSREGATPDVRAAIRSAMQEGGE